LDVVVVVIVVVVVGVLVVGVVVVVVVGVGGGVVAAAAVVVVPSSSGGGGRKQCDLISSKNTCTCGFYFCIFAQALVPTTLRYVTVDTRGAGASFGHKPVDMMPRELLDLREVSFAVLPAHRSFVTAFTLTSPHTFN
jgi:hypothetical protein